MRDIDPDDMHPDFLKAIEKLCGNSDYVRGHLPRYMHTLRHMPSPSQFKDEQTRVLEIGTSFIFPPILLDLFKYSKVDVTHFLPGDKRVELQIPVPNDGRLLTAYNINLEEEALPVPDAQYDMVLFMEVIEHMERDPMHIMCEINRVLKDDGFIYITTPNSTSGRNVVKILNGFAPHFFMQYSKTKSLYRHNIEYDPRQVKAMLEAAGFRMLRFWTADNFEPKVPEILEKLESWGYSTANRGDNILGIAQKVGPPKERFPREIYF